VSQLAAVKQANKLIGMIKLNFIDTVLAAYKSLVRPHLEYYYYCIGMWNPHLAKYIELIKDAQSSVTEFIHGNDN